MKYFNLAATALATMIAGVSNPAGAADLELALSNQSAMTEVIADSASIASGGADIHVGLLFNEIDDVVGHAGLIVRGRPVNEQAVSFGLGAGLYYASLDTPSRSVGALTLGFELEYTIPGNTPIGLGGSLFYAPDVTTFSDGDSLLDLKLRAEIDVLPSATAFIGYRKLSTDLTSGGEHKMDDNVHVGIRIQF